MADPQGPQWPTDKNHAIYSREHPEHKEAVAELKAQFQRAYPSNDGDEPWSPTPAPAPARRGVAPFNGTFAGRAAATSKGAPGVGMNDRDADGFPPPGHPYWLKDHPDHAKAVVEIRREFEAAAAAQGEPLPFSGPIEDLPHIGEMRQMAGVVQPHLPTQLQDVWDIELETELHRSFLQTHTPPAVAQAVLDYYVEAMVLNGGGGSLPHDAEQTFREKFEATLGTEYTNALVVWAKKHLQADARAAE